MKKLYTCLIFSVLLLSSSNAQDFNLFILGGPVGSQVDGDHLGGYNKLGAVLGLGISRQFDEDWSATMELEYIQKGKGSSSETVGDTYKVKLNYIQLPIAVNYHVLENLNLESGLSFAYLMNSKFYENGEPNDAHRPYSPYFYDINWILGGTYSLSEEWKINVRFAYSIFPMGNTLEGEDDVYSSNRWRKAGGQYNNSLAIALQYWL